MEGDALMRNFFTTFRLVVGLILALFGHVLIAQEDPAVESLPKKESASPIQTTRPTKLILVVGAAGEEEYREQFRMWRDRIVELAASTDQFTFVKIEEARDGKEPKQQLQEAIQSTAKGTESLWLVFIGHGTDDRKVSKFNLIETDLSAKELNEWLSGLEMPELPVVVVNCASSSGAWISKLKQSSPEAKRVIVTSGKSGSQYNFARFGEYFSSAIADPQADLDKDQQTSLLEAFVVASQRTQAFYLSENRLATELALIEDSGDGLGTPGDWFEGVRAVKSPKNGLVDGMLASRMILVRRGDEAKLSLEQRQKRDRLEQEFEQLRREKTDLEESVYFQKLERLMLQLAEIYREKLDSEKADGPTTQQGVDE